MGVAVGLSVLVIGASHVASSGYLLTTLHDQLVKQGASVHTMGVCASHPAHWVKPIPLACGAAERKGNNSPTFIVGTQGAKSLEQLAAESKPNWVVVVMGDTIAGYRTSFDPQWASNQVGDLTREIQRLNIKCAWVGPTWGREGGLYGKTNVATQTVSNFLATNTSPCKYIDSLNMSKPGEWSTVDGQHLSSTGYRKWGEKIAKELNDLW